MLEHASRVRAMYPRTGNRVISSTKPQTILDPALEDSVGVKDAKHSSRLEHTTVKLAKGRSRDVQAGLHWWLAGELESIHRPVPAVSVTISNFNCRCILKMDHHCPWTINCVSHRTFPHFIRFLFYAVVSMGYLETLLYARSAVIWKGRNLPSVRGLLLCIDTH